MLEIYSNVHRHINHKLNSQSSTFETTHLKLLPFHTFVIHTNFKPVKFSQKLKPLRLGPYKILKHISDVTYELMSQDSSTFQTHENHNLPYYAKEPVIFPYLKQYHSTPSLINNPDTDPYQATFSQFSSLDTQSIPDSSPTRTSTKDKTVSNDSTPIPKYQNFSYASSLQDNLDITFDSTDSDFEMLPNSIFYSNSSNNFFPQTFPRIADYSHNISLTPPHDPQTVPNYTRAPHSPYNLRSLQPSPPPETINPPHLTSASLHNLIFIPQLNIQSDT